MIAFTIVLLITIFLGFATCGIIRQEEVQLLGNERISKRSVPDTYQIRNEEIADANLEAQDDVATVAIHPFVSIRVIRSAESRLLRDNENGSDLDVAENIVFFPFFRKTQRTYRRRPAREIGAEAIGTRIIQ